MSNYNKYANTFKGATANDDYQEYIKSDVASAPNLAYIQTGTTAGNIVIEKYVPSEHMIFGTTMDSEDFYIGAYNWSSGVDTENSIHCHVIVTGTGINIFYADESDVHGNIKYIYENNGFKSKRVVSVIKWDYPGDTLVSISRMFYKNSTVEYVNLSGLIAKSISSGEQVFDNCKNLKYIDIRNLDTTNCTAFRNLVQSNNVEKIYVGPNLFNGYTGQGICLYSTKWTDTDSLAMFVTAITAHDGTGKTVLLSSQTKEALTQAQKDAITAAGWTI